MAKEWTRVVIGPTEETELTDKKSEDDGDNLPRTCEEAERQIADGLDEESVERLRHIPRWGLIEFHHGWGTGIRNSLGLWGRNPELIESCSRRVGAKRLHTDSVSGIIMRGVWTIINSDLDPDAIEQSSPRESFEKIDAILKSSFEEGDSRAIIVLPIWVFEDNWMRERPSPELIAEAKRLIKERSPIEYLVLLYLSFHNDKRSIDLSEPLLEASGPVVRLPVDKRMMKRRDISVPGGKVVGSGHAVSDADTYFVWKEYTWCEFVLGLLSRWYHVNFPDVETYRRWQRAVEENYLLRNSIKSTINKSDLDSWLKRRTELLKLLMISKGYISYDTGNSETPNDCYREKRDLFVALFDRLREERGERRRWLPPSGKMCDKPCEDLNDESSCWEPCPPRIAYRTLERLADSSDAEELFEAISVDAARAHDESPFNEALYPFARFAVFVILTQKERLIALGRTQELWDICEHYKHPDSEESRSSLSRLMIEQLEDIQRILVPEKAKK